MAAIVVFVTTYALILPAITIDENVAKDEPGIFLDEDNGSGLADDPDGNCNDPDRFENPDKKGCWTSDEILSPDADNADASDGNGLASLLESSIAGCSVNITASVPEGTALSLSEISDEGVSDKAAAVLGKDLESCCVIGLSFVDTEGNDVETDGPAYITVVHDYLSSDGAQLLQLDETGSVRTVDPVSHSGSTASFSATMPFCFVIARPEQDADGQGTEDPGPEGNQKTDLDEVLSDGGMPEQVFRKEINGLTVDVHAPWGTFPDGTVMVVTKVDEEGIIGSIKAAVENGSAYSRVTQVKAVDISFFDADGNEIEPENPIRVSIRDELIASADYQNVLDVVHVDDDGMVSFVSQADDETGKDEVAFDSEEFSVYAIVKSEITVRYLTAEGESYIITVTHGPDAGIPEGAELEVTEILRGRDGTGGAFGFDTYLSMTQDALGLKSSSFAGVRLFDISIVMDGRKIEIASPVEVKIQLDEEKAGLDTFVVHFADGAENGDLVRGVEVDSGKISFEAEGFSAYAIVYVDSPESLSSAWHKITTVGELAEFSSAGTGLYVGHVDGYYFMNTLTADSKRTGITKTGLSPYYPHPDAALYYFEKKEGTEDQFYAYCTRLAEDGVTEIRQYVKNKNSNSLFFTDSRDDATAFTASADSDGKFQISYPTTSTTWYWNMQGGANGKRFCSYNQLDDPNNYLYFWYYIPPTDDPFELDGKTFGLMNWNGGVAGKAMMTSGFLTDPDDDPQTDNSISALAAKSLTVMSKQDDNTDKLFVPNDSGITMWTFEWIEDDLYKVSTQVGGSDRYLSIESGGVSLKETFDDSCRIKVNPGSGSHAGQFFLSSGNTVLTYSGSVDKGFSVGGIVGSEWLYAVELSELTNEYLRTYSASKVSISDAEKVTNMSNVVVYVRYWNESKLRYDYFIIDSDGSLIPAYESGDSIEWVGRQLNEALWVFVEYYWEGTNDPNYYYELFNDYSEKYIAPQVTNGQILSDDTIGINLNGRRDGQYYSSILAWDEDNYSYVGLKVENGQLVSCPRSEVMDFYFALVEDLNVDDNLTTVPTVDHTQYGITMKMIDIGTRKEMSDLLGNDDGGLGTALHQGLLSTDLVGGYPTITKVGEDGQIHSLSEMYTGEKEVNHLFIESTYDVSGYFEFDSTQNFASLGSGNDFVVYKELGSHDANDRETLKHGQFFPFNTLKAGVFTAVNRENLYSLSGTGSENAVAELPDSNPRKHEKLYSIQHDGEKVDYYFAIELTASFMQTPSGLDAWDHDIIFEFTGDDDFWLYVDGELVIDLGGIHSAVPGDVNFRTGIVHVNGNETTLRDLFYGNYVKRGHTAEQAQSYVDGIFTVKYEDDDIAHEHPYYVFEDDTLHTMQIFYMERGAGASNLQMRFNLAAVKKGTVELKKELSGIDNTESVMADFLYHVFYTDSNGEEHLLTNQVAYSEDHPEFDFQHYNQDNVKYKDSVNAVEFYPKMIRNEDGPDELITGVTLDGHEYNDVFVLKPGETAVISFPDGTRSYRIEECGVDSNVYDTVTVYDREHKDGYVITGSSGEGYAANRRDYGIGQASTDDRPRVTYDNHVRQEALKTLTFTKLLYDESGSARIPYSPDEATFQFRLYIASEFETLDVANMYTYHVKNPDGYYCRWNSSVKTFEVIGDGISDYELLTAAQKSEASFTTSIYGTISNIPVDHTVEVRDLLVGTQFRVQERPWELPDGYTFQKYQYNDQKSDGTLITVENGSAGILDSVRNGEADPHVDISNLKGWGMRVNKTWSDEAFMSDRETAYFAVYADHGTDGEKDLRLVEDSVREIAYGDDPQTVYWFYLILPDQDIRDFDKYEILEVKLSGDGIYKDAEGVVSGYDSIEPVDEGGKITYMGTQAGEDTSLPYEYTVLYTEEVSGSQNVKVAEVTNNRPGIVLQKTDWFGDALQGATFSMSYTHLVNGETVTEELGPFTSDGDGRITMAFLAVGVEYTLSETSSPALYSGLEAPVRITQYGDGSVKLSYNGETVEVPTGGTAGTDDDPYFIDNQMTNSGDLTTVTVKNRLYQLRVIKNDSVSGNPIQGVAFELHKQKTVNGVTAFDVNPLQGYTAAELISGANGEIPYLDNTLSAGVYELREMAALTGYRMLPVYVYFTVTGNGIITLETVRTPEGAVMDPDELGITMERSVETSGEYAGYYLYTMTLPNEPQPLMIQKKDASGNDLPGAVFSLKTHTSDGVWENVNTAAGGQGSGTGVIDMSASAMFELSDMQAGLYCLTEVSSPAGYIILTKDVFFRINEDRTVVLTDESGNEASSIQEVSLTGDENGAYTISVQNTPGTALPNTGGRGTEALAVIGTMLIVGSLLISFFVFIRRRRLNILSYSD